MNCSFHRKEQRYLTSRRDHALSFGFSYDFPQESTGLFQIFILPRNFQPFRANSRSAFVWRVTINSQPGCVFMLSPPRELQEDFGQNKYALRAATNVLQFHLTLRESNLPVFKLRSLHTLIQGRTFLHLISRLRVPDDLGHTHVRDGVQLSVNRLRILKQLKRVRSSLLLRFRYAVIICTRRKPRF